MEMDSKVTVPGTKKFRHGTGDIILQRKCACRKHITDQHGECTVCRKKQTQLQRKSATQSAFTTVPSVVHEVLQSPGQPLNQATRAFMEPRFGHDFSGVRVHTDERAAESARAVDANAYTVGRNIVFDRGQFAPQLSSGKQLLAHELAHVMQQSRSIPTRGPLRVGVASGPLESQADGMSKLVVSNRPSTSLLLDSNSGQHSPAVIQRQASGSTNPAGSNQPANQAQADFSGCDSTVQSDLRSNLNAAQARVDNAITSLALGWDRMVPADKGVFNQFFDPANSGEVDDGFVRDVRGNFRQIRSTMNSLTFNCNQDSWTICGSPSDFCENGRLMWTCWGDLHVCPDYATSNNAHHKISTIIHESTHNALTTTDREYHNDPDFSRLSPRGSGILSFLSNIPVLGFFFSLIPANSDTLNNPDSYAEYAMNI